MTPDELRKAGFSDDEISGHLSSAGFSNDEISSYMFKQTDPYRVSESESPLAEGSRPISTITGQQIPTSAEAMAQNKSVYKTAGPIVGDIALTALAPQLSLPVLFLAPDRSRYAS